MLSLVDPLDNEMFNYICWLILMFVLDPLLYTPEVIAFIEVVLFVVLFVVI